MTLGQRATSARRWTRRLLRENSWLLPALGALSGILLALAVRDVGRSPDPGSWAISVNRARDSLMGGLAIVFTGLSIVLALTAVTAQNVANRFSLRLLRVHQRELRDKFVIAVFTMTTTFIMTTQLELRSLRADDVAPRGGMLMSVLLVVFSGATIIWYIGATMKSFRLDQTLQHLGKRIQRPIRALEHSRRGDVIAPPSALQRPAGAVPFPAPRSGYLTNIDTERLHRLATQSDVRVGIDIVIGSFVVHGQPIGWYASSKGSSPPAADELDGAIALAPARDPSCDVAYGIRIFVDMAVTALSPAVNDPYTAVEVVNELTLVLVNLAGRQPGPRGRTGPEGQFVVAIAGRSLGDFLALATDQILLYGSQDPGVTRALSRLAVTIEAVATSEADQNVAQHLSARISAATTQDEVPS